MQNQLVPRLAIAACIAAVMLFAQRAYTQSEAAKPTTDERLAAIEAKIDALAHAVGKVSGRNSLSDYVERGFAENQREMKEIQNEVKRVRDEVRRIPGRR